SLLSLSVTSFYFFFQAEDGIRDRNVTGVQTCALPICAEIALSWRRGSTVTMRWVQQLPMLSWARLTMSPTEAKSPSSLNGVCIGLCPRRSLLTAVLLHKRF